MNRDLKQLLRQLHIDFLNHQLLRQAFTHASYVNEHRMSIQEDNERLEFLGDAVLELTISEYLYHAYPGRSEGELTKHRAAIVCEPSLVSFAEKMEFGTYVLLGKGEELTGGRQRPALLADVFEAFIGALFLDQGLDAVRDFLRRHIFPHIPNDHRIQLTDYKSQLQEYVQQHSLGLLEYRIVDETGPAHEKEFVSHVYMDEALLGEGRGRSKKESEQQAASQALEKLRINPNQHSKK